MSSIANAIRTKGGTSASLLFPDGFLTAIGNIPTGDPPTLITKSITENGTYSAASDNADGYSSVTVSINPKYVAGTFTGTTNGQAKTITIPYTGSGYPVAGIVFPSDGIYKSGSTFADTIQKKAVGLYSFVKSDSSSTPDYTNDTAINQVVVCVAYKSSDEYATSIAQNITTNARLFVNGDAVGNSSIYRVIKFNSATSMSIYIPSTDQYGFMKDVEYTYLFMYSS